MESGKVGELSLFANDYILFLLMFYAASQLVWNQGRNLLLWDSYIHDTLLLLFLYSIHIFNLCQNAVSHIPLWEICE